MDIVVSLIGTFGTLAGVLLGAVLTRRFQAVARAQDEADRSNAARRVLYAEFLTSAREWRAVIMSEDVPIVRGSAVSRHRHADGGRPAARTLGLRSEVALIAGSPEPIRQAIALVRRLGDLAEARAEHHAGAVPNRIVNAVRDCEIGFLVAARTELGNLPLEEPLNSLFSRQSQESWRYSEADTDAVQETGATPSRSGPRGGRRLPGRWPRRRR